MRVPTTQRGTEMKTYRKKSFRITMKGIELMVPYMSETEFNTLKIKHVMLGRRITVRPIVACHRFPCPEFFPLLATVG